MNFRKQVKPKNTEKKQQKEDVPENLYDLFEGRERVLNAFDSKIFPIKIKDTGFSDHSNFKVLTLKQMLQRLPIALARVKAGNTSENLLNEIRQFIYLHRLLLNLTDKIDLRRKDKYVALSNLSIYYTWKNIKTLYKNNKFKISAPT